MKSFTIPCDFNGQKSPFPIYVGEPRDDKHPLMNQAAWLSSERGGTIPPDVMESFAKLQKIAIENKVSFEELCVFALGNAAEEQKQGITSATTATGDAAGDAGQG